MELKDSQIRQKTETDEERVDREYDNIFWEQSEQKMLNLKYHIQSSIPQVLSVELRGIDLKEEDLVEIMKSQQNLRQTEGKVFRCSDLLLLGSDSGLVLNMNLSICLIQNDITEIERAMSFFICSEHKMESWILKLIVNRGKELRDRGQIMLEYLEWRQKCYEYQDKQQIGKNRLEEGLKFREELEKETGLRFPIFVTKELQQINQQILQEIDIDIETWEIKLISCKQNNRFLQRQLKKMSLSYNQNNDLEEVCPEDPEVSTSKSTFQENSSMENIANQEILEQQKDKKTIFELKEKTRDRRERKLDIKRKRKKSEQCQEEVPDKNDKLKEEKEEEDQRYQQSYKEFQKIFQEDKKKKKKKRKKKNRCSFLRKYSTLLQSCFKRKKLKQTQGHFLSSFKNQQKKNSEKNLFLKNDFKDR